jgi:hypothetical protein
LGGAFDSFLTYAFSLLAQIDVLYEVTHTYKEPAVSANMVMEEGKVDTGADASGSSSTSVDGIVNKMTDDDSVADPTATDATGGSTISCTNLAVAVFEGWLHRGSKGDGEGLRWEIAELREAFEFPQHQPTVIRNPAP